MSRKVSLLICFVFVLCLGSNVLAFDQVMPDFAGGEQTCAVLWEFEDGNSVTDKASDTPSLILYDPEPPDACFGFRYDGFSWTGELDPCLAFIWDSNATVVVPEEESVIQPVPDGEGANLTVQVQVMWWPGPNTPNGPGDTPYLAFAIETWEGKGVEAEEGGEHMGGIGNEEGNIEITPIAEVNMAPGWKHSTYRHTFEDFSEEADISHVHILLFGYEHGGLKIDEIVVDMVVHDDPEPPVGPGREWIRIPRAGQARDPVPANRAEHIQPDTNLAWAPDPCLAGPLTYDVWFGTDPCMANNAKIASNIGPCTVDPCAGDLAAGTLFYWRVDTNDPGREGIDFKFTTWGFADDVYPADGAKGVDPPVLLKWGPDGYAATCDIYLGTSYAEVNSANTNTTGIYRGEQAVSDANYDAGMLDLLKTYYWRIDEVSGGTAIKGKVWRFTTGANFVLEDFDRYATNTQLYDVWDDYGVNGSGADIFIEKDADFTLDGNSMFYKYDSAWKAGPTCMGAVADADVVDLLVGSDWTIGGIKSLVIHFLGTADNSTTANDRMWLELEDTSSNSGIVLYDGDVNNLAVAAEWQEWNIDLGVYDACGVDLTNVDKIHLGFGGPPVGDCKSGGTGEVYFDEIELHPRRCRPEVVTWDIAEDDCKTDGFDIQLMAEDWLEKDYQVFPIPPDRNNLLVEYLFATDGNYNDTSGNGFHGQPTSTLTHVANGYLTIENTGGYVDIPFNESNPFHGPTDFSIFINYRSDEIAMTALMTSTDPCLPTDWDDPNVVDIDAVLTTYSPMTLFVDQAHTGSPSAPDDITFYYDNFFKNGTNVAKSQVEGIGSWHSVAVTYDADGGICPDEPWDPDACPPGSVTGLFTVYIDGIKGPDPANFDPNIPADANHDIVRIGDGYNELHVEDLGFATHIGDINEVLIYDVALTEGEVYYLSGITDPTYVANSSVANVVPKSPAGGPYDPNNPDIVNLMDYGLLGDHWLEAPLLWP